MSEANYVMRVVSCNKRVALAKDSPDRICTTTLRTYDGYGGVANTLKNTRTVTYNESVPPQIKAWFSWGDSFPMNPYTYENYCEDDVYQAGYILSNNSGIGRAISTSSSVSDFATA
jgi:hypothetical protein